MSELPPQELRVELTTILYGFAATASLYAEGATASANWIPFSKTDMATIYTALHAQPDAYK